MIDRMEYGEFIGSVEYSDKDDLLFGKIEGINDLVTFEGGSVRELRKGFKEAVEDYVSLQPLTLSKCYLNNYLLRL